VILGDQRLDEFLSQRLQPRDRACSSWPPRRE
jgi:hypothetical protein